MRELIKKAEVNPDRYVLKPQKEGGGNNYYGDKIRQMLSEELNLRQYLLMERIMPPATQCAMLRQGKLNVRERCVSELGIFSHVFVNTEDCTTDLVDHPDN